MSKNSATLACIRQLACLGLPPGLFVASLLPILRKMTQSAGAAFFWLDEGGRVANLYADPYRMPGEAAAGMPPAQDAGHLSEATVFAPLRAHARSATLDDANAEHGWYREVLRDRRARYVLEGAARHALAEIGRLALFRDGDAPPFGPAETEALSPVMRYVTRGLLGPESALPAMAQESHEMPEEEFLIADPGGQVRYATEAAQRLLLFATGCALAPGGLAAAQRESRRLLCDLCAAPGCGGARHPGGMRRETTWGTFVLRTYRLTAPALPEGAMVGVHIRRDRPDCLRYVAAMDALPLSPQQREIALMIARGSTKRDIAARLSVSLNTVAYHVKRLFEKLGVHDRAELLARLHVGGAVQRSRTQDESRVAAD